MEVFWFENNGIDPAFPKKQRAEWNGANT